MEDNNIQDSCCNSKYASIRQMDKLDEMLGRRFPFYPRTVIQAVHDGRTGASLEAILAQYNLSSTYKCNFLGADNKQ